MRFQFPIAMNSSMEEEPEADMCESYQKPFLKLYVEPSKIHNNILSKLEQKRSVIIHNMPKPGMKAIYSLGIIPSLMSNLDFCLVITPISYCENIIIQTMKHLIDVEGLKVKINSCSFLAYINSTGFDVAVGLPRHAFLLLEQRTEVKEKIRTVVFDWGNELVDDDDEKNLIAVIKRAVRELGEEVQVVVSVEQKLKESSLSIIKEILKVTDEFSSPVVPPTKSMVLGRRTKHQYVFVEEDYDVMPKICDLIHAQKKKPKGGNTIIFSGGGYTLDDLAFELPEEYDIPVSTTKMHRYMTKEEIETTVKEFLDDTHVLIAYAPTVSDINSFISKEVNLIISCGGWGHPRNYLQHLYPYEGLSSVITFVDEEEVSQLFDIQECFRGLVFDRLRDDDGSVNFQKRDIGGKHIVCKMLELEHFFVRLLTNAGVSIIFVKDDSELMRMMKLEKEGVYITYRKQHETLKAQHERMIQNNGSSKPLVYVTLGNKDDFDCFSELLKQQKVGMVINYDMPSDVETYCRRVGWCDNKHVVIINPTSDVDLPRCLGWQIELGVCFEPFFPPRVMSHLDMACGKSATYCVQEDDYYYYLKNKHVPFTPDLPELHSRYLKRLERTLLPVDQKKKKKKVLNVV